MSKPTKEDKLAQVFHFDLYGKREHKYDFLNQNNIASITWNTLEPTAPNHFFVNKNFEELKNYEKGFALNELFTLNNVGIVTAKDAILINEKPDELIKNVEDFYQIKIDKSLINPIAYRPFDNKLIYYDVQLVERAREKVMQHFIKADNLGLVYKLGNAEENSVAAMVTKNIIDFRSWSRPGMQGGDYVAPLYIYPNFSLQQTINQSNERTPNLNTEIVNQIATKLGLTFTNEKEITEATFAPIDILDYIYAVLHSPTYRKKYQEFLKIDFPRVPYPKDKNTFFTLVKLGTQLRLLHLLQSPIVEQYITQYPISGNNVVTKPTFIFLESSNPNSTNGRVYINDTQYFGGVPIAAWEFYIGGYQPAQKWLKDRKGRKLEFEDIAHYQKMMVALIQTSTLMDTIDKIKID